MPDLEALSVQFSSATLSVSDSSQLTRTSYSEAQAGAQSGLRVGSSFGEGRYRVGKLLGCGGTCVVHEVDDRWLDRRLAGKFFTVDHPSVVIQAHLEARATARLRHPNIVTLVDAGFHGDVPYLLLERLQGATLAQELARGPLAPRRALSVVMDIASAVVHAHQRGVLHLDLKPANVHLGDDGTVKLLDFGVGGLQRARGARAPGDENGVRSTLVGTPCYMAPEQWNLGPLDARTDVWALGLLLYECLSGKVACDGRHPGFALLSGQRFAAPLLKRSLGLPSSVNGVIERALTLVPEGRFQTAREFASELHLAYRALPSGAVDGAAGRYRAELTSPERAVLAFTHVANAGFQAPELQLLSKVR